MGAETVAGRVEAGNGQDEIGGFEYDASEGASSMKIGSLEHRDAFCRQFTQTYSEYDPTTLPWPVLDDEALHRLRSVPFWEEVFYTERRAGAIVAAFTETVADPVLREALALQGEEETRHARLIRVMIEKYGLDAPERPMEDISENIETRFKDFGFGECLDSFLGFGLFKIALQSEFLPKEMLQDLRNADVRGNPSHRLLRQLDGLYRGAAGMGRPDDSAAHQPALLPARRTAAWPAWRSAARI